MSKASSTMKNLTLRLIAYEAANAKASDAPIDHAIVVCEKLRLPFSRLAGVNGFSSFLSRSLALAKAEFPSLCLIEIQPDGTLVKRGALEQTQETLGTGPPGGALVEHLLQLLVTFIGERLTATMVLDAWPDGSLENTNVFAEGKP